MNSTQRTNIEKIWEQTDKIGLRILFVQSVERQLHQCAEQDLRYARKEGQHIVAQTQHGNLTVTVWPCKKGYAINSAAGLLYSGTKAGAVECLVNAYQVVAE